MENLLRELKRLGWVDGRNVRIASRVAGGSADALRKHAAELIELAPQVLVAAGSATTEHLLHATQTVPIVFTIVSDPGAGFVANLSRPGGNAQALCYSNTV